MTNEGMTNDQFKAVNYAFIGHFPHWSFLTFIPQGCDIYLSDAPNRFTNRLLLIGWLILPANSWRVLAMRRARAKAGCYFSRGT